MQKSTSDLSSQSAWFSTFIQYKGRGRAEFEAPKGSIQGEVTIFFDEMGRYEIEMLVDPASIQSDPPLRTGLLEELLSSSPVKQEGNSIYFGLGGGKRNTCTSLVVDLADGILKSVGRVSIGQLIQHFSNNKKDKIKFRSSEFHFVPNKSKEPKYWVIPLTNFLSSFIYSTQQFQELENHPLLLKPEGNIIAFLFREKPAYIEPLLDYKARADELKSGTARHLITSLMVGEGIEEYQSYAEISTWLASELIILLSVAVGIEVGASRIEFFSEDGELVKRIHINLGNHCFYKGHTAIRENIDNGGIGYFLTKAQSMPAYGLSITRVVSRYLIQGGQYHPTIETQLVHLFRAFEALTKHYNIDTIDLSASLSLEDKNQVIAILSEASSQIKAMATNHSVNGNYIIAGEISRISQRVGNTIYKDKAFGLSVVNLLQNFNLPDSDIVDSYLLANPRSDNSTWSGILSYYRGVVIHEGYFGFVEGKHEFDDVWTVRIHLHDILLRIIFQLLGYNGTYQPTVSYLPTKESIDWVLATTPADRLGYE